MKQFFTSASIVGLGFLTSGCAQTYCCGPKPIESEATKPAAREAKVEIDNLVTRARNAGMKINKQKSGQTGYMLVPNFNHDGFEDFIRERLSTGLGNKIDNCVKKQVIQNISWSVRNSLVGDPTEIDLHTNTWRNVQMNCKSAFSNHESDVKTGFEKSAETLRVLNFTPMAPAVK